MLRRSGMQPRVLNLAVAAWNRASPFSSSPYPPPSSSSSGNSEPPNKELKAPPKQIAMPFMGQIKKARSAGNAIRVITKIERQGYHPDVFHYSAIISKCAKDKLVDKALGLLKRMISQGVAPNVFVFGAVIDAFANAGQYKSAISLLSDMQDKYGVEPNEKCFSSAISACEKGGAKYTNDALSLLDEAKSVGIKLDATIYSAAISACEKGGAKYTETALALFHEMKMAGVKPNDVTYRATIQACFDSKRYPEALQLARDAAKLPSRFVKDRPVHIKISTESGLPKWDLHLLTEATACMLLADALLSLVRSDGIPISYQDIIVITGKGLGTIDPCGPVLREKVPSFLNDVAGLETTAIEGNEGRFLVTAASLEIWAASGAYEKFKGLFRSRIVRIP